MSVFALYFLPFFSSKEVGKRSLPESKSLSSVRVLYLRSKSSVYVATIHLSISTASAERGGKTLRSDISPIDNRHVHIVAHTFTFLFQNYFSLPKTANPYLAQRPWPHRQESQIYCITGTHCSCCPDTAFKQVTVYPGPKNLPLKRLACYHIQLKVEYLQTSLSKISVFKIENLSH